MLCWKSQINLQLTLSDKPPPPACQVRPQPQRPGPSRLRIREQRNETRTAAANASNATDVNEAEAFKKPSGNLTADSSENKSLRRPLQDSRLTDKETESLLKFLLNYKMF